MIICDITGFGFVCQSGKAMDLLLIYLSLIGATMVGAEGKFEV